MPDKEISGLVKKLSDRSFKSQIVRQAATALNRPEPQPKHEMSRKEFEEYSSKCDQQKPWEGASYKQCNITESACRDSICPKLKGSSGVTQIK